MPNQPKNRTAPKSYTLRQRAEVLLTERSQDLADMPVTDLHRLVYELQLHQIELDLQNEELRRAQDDLQISRNRYADLYDFAPVGYLRLDGNGVIIEANLTAAQLLAASRSHIIGRRLTDWVAPEAQDTIYRHRLQVFAEDTTHTCTLWMERQDGTPFYAHLKSLTRREADAASLYWWLAFIDLTAMRREAEEQLAWNVAIVDNSRDAIIGMDLDGTIRSWNPAAERLYGYRASEILGHPIDRIAPPEFNDDLPYMNTTLQHSERIAHYETKCLTKDGRRFDASLTLSPIRTRDGIVIGISAIARNITLRKQREAKLRATERALRQSHAQLRRLIRRQQQMQERISKRMAQEIHDELAQLLTGLQIDIAWIIQQNALSPKVHERLHSMSAQVDRLDKTAHHIATELRPRLLDDLGLLAAIEWQLEDMMQRTGLTYTLHVPSEPLVELDADRTTALFRIFQEALTNVVRHAEASQINVWIRQDAEDVYLEIHDNGKGIAAPQQGYRDALGILGMHERAQLWGGEVNIASQPGNGTTVLVRLPLLDVDDEEAAP